MCHALVPRSRNAPGISAVMNESVTDGRTDGQTEIAGLLTYPTLYKGERRVCVCVCVCKLWTRKLKEVRSCNFVCR